MDPLTALSLAASVVQLLEVGVKISRRHMDYVQAHAGDLPKPLENISILLPLIVKSVSAIEDEAAVRDLADDTRVILHGVLGCSRLTRELEEIANKISLTPGENIGGRLKRAFGSIKYEERIKDIDKGLQAYVQVLVLHQVVKKSEVPKYQSSGKKYFEVKIKRVANPVSRASTIARLHDVFDPVVRSQRNVPLCVALRGGTRVGKSHIALEYSHNAYDLGYYGAVFWLDAATPASLNLGLESSATTIRQSRSESSVEKIKFLINFLVESWYPWLLVLDNYAPKQFDACPLTSLLPQTGHGAILLSTQSKTVQEAEMVIEVFKFRTEKEETALRFDVSRAIYKRELDVVIDALSSGLDPNSYSATVFQDKHQALINLAAETGYDEVVRLLLDLGANPHLVENHGSVLSVAAHYGYPSIITICFDHEDRTGYRFEQDHYDHAVRAALQNGHSGVIKAILSRRADKIDPTSHLVASGFAEAIDKGYRDAVQILYSHGKIPSSGGPAALGKAIKRGHLDLIEFLINEMRIDPNENNDNGEPALNTAVSCRPPAKDGDCERIVKILLDAGASPNQKDRRLGSTSLHAACTIDAAKSLTILLEHGGDPTIEIGDGINKGENVLERASSWKSPNCLVLLAKVSIADPEVRKSYYARAIHMAAKSDNRELLLILLKGSHADINAIWGPSNDTPLLASIKAGKLPTARMLIRNGASQDISDKNGGVAMLLSAQAGLGLLIKDLVKSKDSPSLEVKDRQGNTPLIVAVKNGHEDTVKVLLGLGADKDAMNDFAETAIDLAEDSRYKEIVDMLEKLGRNH